MEKRKEHDFIVYIAFCYLYYLCYIMYHFINIHEIIINKN